MHIPGSTGVNSVAYTPDKRWLAAGDGNGDVYLWNAATGQRVETLPDPGSGGILGVAVSPDGNTLGTDSPDGTVYQWRVEPRMC
jgi:WD40 repeat protein